MSSPADSASSSRRSHESLDQFYARLRERSDREDLVMFINAGCAATQQGEYYAGVCEQSVSIEFLHQYVLANYRRLYARTLAAGINHFHQALIIANLLAAGAPSDAAQRAEEGTLIAAALRRLPANRAYGLLANLARRRINNRRTRAIIKSYLRSRREPQFDAVKYRRKYRTTAAHAHLNLGEQLGADFGDFLFQMKKSARYQTPLFEQYRRGHYSAQAIYDLPYTVAESLAQKHGVPRDVFLQKIEPKLTALERLRLQSSADRAGGVELDFDLGRAPLTRLALFVLSLPIAERRERGVELHEALQRSAKRALERVPLQLGRVAAVLDRSRSTFGSREKRRRPLAVALAASYLFRAASAEYRAIWTPAHDDGQWEFTMPAVGQTDLAEPLLDAFEWQPEMILIVSDGYENDPPGAVDQVAQVFQKRLAAGAGPEIVHFNPVFDSHHFAPRTLGQTIATVGLRDAEDAGTMLGFARFVCGAGTLQELEDYLAVRVQRMLERHET
ncbi:MAG: hypothetical protein U0939_17630 [Pirellulales bacterium]